MSSSQDTENRRFILVRRPELLISIAALAISVISTISSCRQTQISHRITLGTNIGAYENTAEPDSLSSAITLASQCRCFESSDFFRLARKAAQLTESYEVHWKRLGDLAQSIDLDRLLRNSDAASKAEAFAYISRIYAAIDDPAAVEDYKKKAFEALSSVENIGLKFDVLYELSRLESQLIRRDKLSNLFDSLGAGFLHVRDYIDTEQFEEVVKEAFAAADHTLTKSKIHGIWLELSWL